MDKEAFAFPLCCVNVLKNWALPPLICASFHSTGAYAEFCKGGSYGNASEFCLCYNVHKSSVIQKLIILLHGR